MLDQILVHAGNQMLVLASTQQHCLPRRHACGLLLQRPEHTVCKGAELAWRHEQKPTAGGPALAARAVEFCRSGGRAAALRAASAAEHAWQ